MSDVCLFTGRLCFHTVDSSSRSALCKSSTVLSSPVGIGIHLRLSRASWRTVRIARLQFPSYGRSVGGQRALITSVKRPRGIFSHCSSASVLLLCDPERVHRCSSQFGRFNNWAGAGKLDTSGHLPVTSLPLCVTCNRLFQEMNWISWLTHLLL